MNNIIKRVWNQNRMVNIEDLRGMAFQAEDGGHTFEISGINDANDAVSLTGTVAGVFMRPDGTDVALTGTASDGVVSVTLSDACYAVAGRFGFYIFVTSDSKKTCVYACIGTVAQTSYGAVAGDTPQDVVDLINAINDAIASIPADYSDLLDSIAPSFSDSMAYTSGTIVWYNGLLYQFTADKASGSWDATKVNQISVSTAQFNTANFEDGAVTLPKLGADVLEELGTKANIDGSYESMTVGNAEQLISSVGIEDQTPYNFRTSGGSTEIGDREELNAIVGVSVPWNQLLNPTMAGASGTYGGVTVTRNGDGSITFNGTATTNAIYSLSTAPLPHVEAHKYFMGGYKKVGNNTGYISHVGLGLDKGNGCVFSDPDASSSMTVFVVIRSGDVFDNVTMYPILVNLTLLLGSIIADYIYALEQSSAGSGVAYFRKLFPKPYYAYNAGELLSVQTSEHRMVGFNQWDEEWELGGLVGATGATYSANDRIRSKNFCRCVPSTVYYCKAPNVYTSIWWYDASKGFIKWESAQNATNQKTVTSPSDAAYFKLVIAGNTTTYGNDLCLNISWPGYRNGEYEPYIEHTYPLDSSLTLRGIPKLDASNNLYYDGDTYEPDGTVTRKYGIVDLGTLNWSYSSNTNKMYSTSIQSLAKPNPSASTIANIVCAYYVTDTEAHTITHTSDKIIALSTTGIIQVYDSEYTDANAFKTDMSGVYLVYELATPTTETAEPYQELQVVNDLGTEEFVDERDVAIPVGNETVYRPNLRAKLEMAPDSPDGDGDYIVRQTNGQNSYIPLVYVKELPNFPSNDGLYKLRCTVSNGTATLSWVSDS